MKRQILLTLVVVACFGLCQSCATFPCTTLQLNVAGVNSRIVGESDSWSGALGGQVGVDALLPFNCSLPLNTYAGVNLSMQGAKWEEDWGEGLTKGITRLTYLNIPVVTRYNFGNGFFAEAGLQPGFLLSAKDKFENVSYDYKEYVKTFDLGIPLGVGYEFPNNFGVGFRVTPGLTSINKGDYASYKDRNFVFAIRGTYTIPKK